MKRKILVLALTGATLIHTNAMAAEAKLRVFVISNSTSFATVNWNWVNQSTPGIQINNVEFFGGPPIDYILRQNTNEFSTIYNPAGGARALVRGEERANDGNNGCTNGVAYNLSSFDPGDSFRFSVDPETAGCGSAVVDYRPALNGDLVTARVVFSNGITLAGNDWTKDLIDPQGADVATNQRYFLTLSQFIADPPPPVGGVPEPSSWAMLIAGFGLTGVAARRRRLASPTRAA